MSNDELDAHEEAAQLTNAAMRWLQATVDDPNEDSPQNVALTLLAASGFVQSFTGMVRIGQPEGMVTTSSDPFEPIVVPEAPVVLARALEKARAAVERLEEALGVEPGP